MIAQALRWVNRVRPGLVGRKFTARVGRRFLPPGAVASRAAVGRGVCMTLHLDRHLDSAIYFFAFERSTLQVLRSVLRPGDNFVDVGANMGFHTLHAARIVGPRGRVLAFEPNPDAAIRLAVHVRENGLAAVVGIRRLALGASAGEATLRVPVGEDGLATLADSLAGTMTTVRVVVRRLDDEWPADAPLRLIKVDVEGAELPVLEGAADTLRRWRPDVICEANPESAARFGYAARMIVDYMSANIRSYRVHVLTSRGVVRDVDPTDERQLFPRRVENWWFQPLD